MLTRNMIVVKHHLEKNSLKIKISLYENQFEFIDVLKSLEITLILQNFFSQSFSDWQLQLNTSKNN